MREGLRAGVMAVLVCGYALSLMAESPQPTPTTDSSDLLKVLKAEDFPNLGKQFAVIAPASRSYNSFGAVLGKMDQWINPPEVSAENPLAGADKLFGQVGYRRASKLDTGHVAGTQKAVVYGKLASDGKIETLTHAVYEAGKGKWNCKLGSLHLIQIEDPKQVVCPLFGSIVAVYERPEPRPE